MKYTYQEVLEASIEYHGDDMSAATFADKYALVDNDGVYYEKTPDDMHKRLARELAKEEAKFPNPMSEEEIYSYFKDFKYIIPQGSPMSAIGNPFKIMSTANCFVIPSPLDSYAGILYSDQQLVQLMKRRGGVGLDISNIRPKGMITNNAAKTTDGIGIFMERFSNTCREVAQKGRRGAEMQSISVHHPEILTFVKIKADKTKVTGANVSVRLSDEFMNAVMNDADYEQRWPVTGTPQVTKIVRAKDVWDEIIYRAWDKAEPGLLFWDKIIEGSPADVYGKVNNDFNTISTNPCSEIGMGVDSCRLTAINLFSFVINPFTNEAYFDYEKYSKVVQSAQRIMDDIVELELTHIQKIIDKVESDPEPEEIKAIEINLWKRFKKNCELGRRTGLGITALGDTIAALGMRYGSPESIAITDEIYKSLAVNAYKSSAIMAQERGAFPLYDGLLEANHEFINRILDQDVYLKTLHCRFGRRNIALTTTAPTGSLSTQTQTTSGIEPAFNLEYWRFKKVNPGDKNVTVDRVDDLGDAWQKFKQTHRPFKMWQDISGKTNVEDSPYYKSTANDIDWMSSVAIQAAAQKWVCHSISKTCNLPKDATQELVGQIYLEAWKSGCKGFTVYREGCRDGVLVNDSEDNSDTEHDNLNRHEALKRPAKLLSETNKTKMDTGDGEKNAYTTISFFPKTKRPYEVFINTQIENNLKDLQILDLATRMTSLALRHGIETQFIVDQLRKVDGQYIYSIPNSLAKALDPFTQIQQSFDDNVTDLDLGLQKRIADGMELPPDTEPNSNITGSKCPKCGEKAYVFTEGCGKCLSCGHSGCS